MPDPAIRQDSLVLYKNRPACVKRIGDKLEIKTDEGKTLKVRPKDIIILHPGPLSSLSELRPQQGEVETAWELLAGSTTTLPELAELVYGAYTPATAWSTWELVADGLYFRGVPAEIIARSAEEVAGEQAARRAKAAEEQAWAAFLERARADQIRPEDSRYLREVEELALGRRSNSRLFRELGRSESPENAHAWLLKVGHWADTVDPYPPRLGLNLSPPAAALPELLEEPRRDLTHLPAWAIDDEGSQDPDDALSLAENRLWVHVADVAALVRPDSPADLEARARGASLYLPEGTIPMLPPRATEKLALGLAGVSPALSFGLELNPQGQVMDVEITPSWVQVQRLSYEEAEARLAEEPFHSLYRLAETYQASRYHNGAVFIELPEVKIRVEEGQVVIRPLPPLQSRTLVREAMLMAGEAVARFAIRQAIPFPFTTQEPPEEASQQPDTLAGMFARRRSLKRSQMSSLPAPHAGLGLEVYAQVTSPLRRYLDLVGHQQLRAYLRGEDLLDAQEILERLGAAEAIAGSVREAERLARRHWMLVHLLRQPNWHGQGVVVDKRGPRSVILIPDLELEIQMRLREDLPLDSTVSLTLRDVNLAELDARFLPADSSPRLRKF